MTPSILEADLYSLRMLELIRGALDDDGFVIHAQPIVDMATAQPLKHELTLQLPGDEGRLIAPTGFWPTARWFGLATELDDLLIRRAVELARDGHAVAVGVCAASRADPDLARRTEQVVIDGQIDPALLTFELTEEGLTANAVAAASFVQRVHALGCALTVEHFGSGYAGFGYLKQVPVDCLKIDTHFAAGLHPTFSQEQFVRSFVELARGHGMRAAADGVPDAAAHALLQDMGFDQAQGAFFGMPSALPAGGAPPVTVLRDVGDEA